MDLKRLLEKMNKFAGEPEQKPGDQVRGTEKAKSSGKEHPFKNRLVGEDNILKDLEKQIKEGALERELTNELNFFKTNTPAKGKTKSYLEPEPEVTEPEEDFEDKFYIKDRQRYLLHREGNTYQLSLGDQLIKAFTAPGKAVHEYLEQNGWRLQQSAVKHNPNWFKEGDEVVAVDNPTDSVTVDVPLLIRLLEYAREDAKDDMDLHRVAEKLVSISAQGQTLNMDSYDSIVGNDIEVEDAEESFGYKKLRHDLVKAQQKYPMAKSDTEAMILYTQDKEQQDVAKLGQVNDREDAAIAQLDHEDDTIEQQLVNLSQQIKGLEAILASKRVKEEVAPAVATATQVNPQAAKVTDPAQLALQKQQQAKLQQNLANLKSAGVDIDPAKAAQTLQKTDTGAPMSAIDKDTISKLAPAIGNVMSNPSTATQLNTLIKKAGGGQ